ncbi:MAG: S26 family signal peptidase, partial [Candidatus Thermoplasmatota archaeon]|nr:S26 family signal peptidase [Candidatus Thermoplasmatota archaeon]
MDKAQLKKEAFSLARDVIIAMVIVGIILGSVVLYTGNWPPLVVVESGSMRHSQDSAIGPIDAGDLVLVKAVNSRQDVITYLEGVERQHVQILDGQGVLEYQFNHTGTRSPYSTYGEAGDVIVYYKNGDRADTPIIHRAILWVEYNSTGGGGFNVPELGLHGFSGKIRLLNMGHLEQTVVIDLGDVLAKGFNATGRPHGGFITLGDANRGSYDQRSHRDAQGNPIEPIEVFWIYGVARGEIPWFGAIKLHFSNDPGRGEIPGNVWTNIILTIGALIGAAISLDILT